jgi:hypothetical protein
MVPTTCTSDSLRPRHQSAFRRKTKNISHGDHKDHGGKRTKKIVNDFWVYLYIFSLNLIVFKLTIISQCTLCSLVRQ